MIEAHQASLSQRHARLDQQIAAETQRPVPDNVAITRMKREKLRLKEELSDTRH